MSQGKMSKVQGGSKKKEKGNPLLAAILKYFMEVMNWSVYIFGKFRLFYVSSEEKARMSLLRLFEHIL